MCLYKCKSVLQSSVREGLFFNLCKVVCRKGGERVVLPLETVNMRHQRTLRWETDNRGGELNQNIFIFSPVSLKRFHFFYFIRIFLSLYKGTSHWIEVTRRQYVVHDKSGKPIFSRRELCIKYNIVAFIDIDTPTEVT